MLLRWEAVSPMRLSTVVSGPSINWLQHAARRHDLRRVLTLRLYAMRFACTLITSRLWLTLSAPYRLALYCIEPHAKRFGTSIADDERVTSRVTG